MRSPPAISASEEPPVKDMEKTEKPRARRSGDRAERNIDVAAGLMTLSPKPTPARARNN